MNVFDQFMKHDLRVKYYARYTDDFIIVSEDKEYLDELLIPIQFFLSEELKLQLHPNKVTIRKYNNGIDFLGYVNLPHHIQLRTKTKKRMLRKLKQRIVEYKQSSISRETLEATLQSYLGILSHAHAYHLAENLKNKFWFWLYE